MAKIDVIGVGPGGKGYLTPAALQAAGEAQVLAGGERNLALFENHPGETFTIKNNLAELVLFIKEKKDNQKVAVLASGDPGMFGILSYLRRHFAPDELNVIPGISTVQVACARLAIPWHDAVTVSTHGRERGKLIETVRREKKVVVLAGPDEPPPELAQTLLKAGVAGRKVYICSDLTYPTEQIKGFTLNGLASHEESRDRKNYIMVILDE